MKHHYTAKIYFGQNETEQQSGDDADELYNWMLMKTQGAFGNYHGEIIDNKTKKVVRAFRKAPPD